VEINALQTVYRVRNVDGELLESGGYISQSTRSTRIEFNIHNTFVFGDHDVCLTKIGKDNIWDLEGLLNALKNWLQELAIKITPMSSYPVTYPKTTNFNPPKSFQPGSSFEQ
jgi:hypothetical protein